jgi:hypothetical protein
MSSTLLKASLLLLISLTTSGCASLFGPKIPEPRPVEIRTVQVRIPITHPTMPRAIDLKDPRWYVVSDANIDTFMEDIRKQNNGGVVFVAMSVGDYELMAYNMQEIRRYINQLKEVVVYYRTVNTDEPEVVENPNGENAGQDVGSNP